MSQKHLYGTDYAEFNPPKEWKGIGVEATIDDSSFEASVNTNEFIFEGAIAKFIQEEWIPNYGLFNGVPYRQIMISEKDPAITHVAFDGFIHLSERVILSESGPIIFRAPIVELQNNVTVFDKMSIITQGLLEKKGFLTPADAIDIPTIKESKKNIAERTLILGQLGFTIVSTAIGAIQNLMSAISDIVGVSALLGLIEIGLLFVNLLIEINLLAEQIFKHKDLFFPSITYYKGLSMKKIMEKAAAFEGYTIDFGEFDPVISKIFLMSSQTGFDGFPSQGFPASGILRRVDWGYRIGQLMQTIETFFNTRQDVRDNVIHMKNIKDPFWTSDPAFQPVDAKLETTEQYQNGTIKEDTDRIKAVVIINYLYDASDTHTLTENSGDSFEIHRRLKVELDPRMNTLKGIQEIQIPYAMAVRKVPFDNLLDLFTGISNNFDFWLNTIQNQISAFSSDIAGAGIDVSTILHILGLSQFLENREGVLKIEDNAFGVPKLLYLVDTSAGKRIPENFKDFIGGKAIYVNGYLPDSPADVNDFKGQYRLLNQWRIPFNVENLLQIKDNPFYETSTLKAKFTTVSMTEDGRFAVTDSEQNIPIDENITEIEI